MCGTCILPKAMFGCLNKNFKLGKSCHDFGSNETALNKLEVQRWHPQNKKKIQGLNITLTKKIKVNGNVLFHERKKSMPRKREEGSRQKREKVV